MCWRDLAWTVILNFRVSGRACARPLTRAETRLGSIWSG